MASSDVFGPEKSATPSAGREGANMMMCCQHIGCGSAMLLLFRGFLEMAGRCIEAEFEGWVQLEPGIYLEHHHDN